MTTARTAFVTGGAQGIGHAGGLASDGWRTILIARKAAAEKPKGRAARPARIAASVARLRPADAGFITGQAWVVDGGTSLGGLNI